GVAVEGGIVGSGNASLGCLIEGPKLEPEQLEEHSTTALRTALLSKLLGDGHGFLTENWIGDCFGQLAGSGAAPNGVNVAKDGAEGFSAPRTMKHLRKQASPGNQGAVEAVEAGIAQSPESDASQ